MLMLSPLSGQATEMMPSINKSVRSVQIKRNILKGISKIILSISLTEHFSWALD